MLQRGLPFLPVAYFIMGNSTAGWYYDAFKLPSDKILLGYASYARMVGYRYLALDYEDPETNIKPELIAALRRIPDIRLVISDEFTPESAQQALALGADTLITPSDLVRRGRGSARARRRVLHAPRTRPARLNFAPG